MFVRHWGSSSILGQLFHHDLGESRSMLPMLMMNVRVTFELLCKVRKKKC